MLQSGECQIENWKFSRFFSTQLKILWKIHRPNTVSHDSNIIGTGGIIFTVEIAQISSVILSVYLCPPFIAGFVPGHSTKSTGFVCFHFQLSFHIVGTGYISVGQEFFDQG